MRVVVPSRVYNGLTVELPLFVYFAVAVLLALSLAMIGVESHSAALLTANLVGFAAAGVARWAATSYVVPPSDDEVTREVMREFNERSRNAIGKRK